MANFTELSPDPFTPFTQPGEAGWRDWFLRLGAFLTDIVKMPARYGLTEGRMAVAVANGLLADTEAITVVNDTPIFPSGLVADLPDVAETIYGRRIVTDASAPAFGSAVVGGGADVVPVYSNGTDWLVG